VPTRKRKSKMSNIQPSVKNVEKQDLEAIASFYNLPAPVAKMMFSVIGDTLYPKLQFLLYQAHKRGVQRIELSQPKEVGGEWMTEARVYPYVPPSVFNRIIDLPPDERKAMWDYYTKPTIEWGRSSLQNVANPLMRKWLPEMSRKRAAARALRLYAGIGQTAYEEMPEATLTKEELESDGFQGQIITGESPSVPATGTSPQAEPFTDLELCSCEHTRKLHLDDGKSLECMQCNFERRQANCNLLPRPR
jgi:hypothetical protein